MSFTIKPPVFYQKLKLQDRDHRKTEAVDHLLFKITVVLLAVSAGLIKSMQSVYISSNLGMTAQSGMSAVKTEMSDWLATTVTHFIN